MNKERIPSLRFPEFSDSWNDKKVGDLADVKRGAGSQYLSYVNDPNQGIRLIRIGDFLGNDPVYVLDTDDMKRFRLKKDDILIAGTGATAGITFLVPDKFVDLAFSYNAPRIRPKKVNSMFLISYLKSERILRQQNALFTGNAQPFLDTKSISGFKLFTPSIEEQQKIASFLSSVDQKIQQLKRKKKLLEEYKKGVMQKLFSQEIRFKDENGENFPDWKTKRLGKLGAFSKGKGIAKKDIIEEGEHRCIRYGELYTTYNEMIDEINSRTNLPVDKLVFSKSNDVLIPSSGETHIDIATASCVLKDGIALGGDINIFRTKQNGVFISYYLKNAYKHQIASLAQGNSVIHLYSKQLKSLEILLPSIEEQNKIVDFLEKVDYKMQYIFRKISSIQNFKKGLLQQMFV